MRDRQATRQPEMFPDRLSPRSDIVKGQIRALFAPGNNENAGVKNHAKVVLGMRNSLVRV
jgi:hypothetical protein